MFVHGGWYIDDNGNIVNKIIRWGWLSKTTIFEKKKLEKNNVIYVNNPNFCGKYGKWKFQKSHKLVLCLNLRFEQFLQKAHILKLHSVLFSYTKRNRSKDE